MAPSSAYRWPDRLPLEVDGEVEAGQREHHAVDQRGIQELAAPAVRIGVDVEVVALRDDAAERDEPAARERLLPRELRDAGAVAVGEGARRVGERPDVLLGALVDARAAESLLRVDLRAEPARGPGFGRIVDGPLRVELERVVPHVGRTRGRVRHARVREDLADAVPQSAGAQPVLRALEQWLGRDDVDERAGLEQRVADRVLRREVGLEPGRRRGKQRERLRAARGFALEDLARQLRARGGRGRLSPDADAGRRQEPLRHLRLRDGHHASEAVDQDDVVGRRGRRRGRAPGPGRRPQPEEAPPGMPVGVLRCGDSTGRRPYSGIRHHSVGSVRMPSQRISDSSTWTQ